MKRRKKKERKPSGPVMSGGFEAARRSPDREIPWWPTLDPRYEVDSFDLYALWTKSRWLYANSPEVSMAVQSIAALCGWLMPLPATSDHEWNRLARTAFLRRVLNRDLFDASRKMNWKSAQLWLEQRAVVDGDCLTVLRRRPDGGGYVSFVAAPQISGDDSSQNMCAGVRLGREGEAVEYNITSPDGQESVRVPASLALLYQQRPDPARPRGYSELAAALANIQDVKEINGYSKIAIKNAAAFAFFEEKALDDPRAAQAGIFQQRRAARNGTEPPASGQPDNHYPFTEVNGVRMVSLPPGRKATILTDQRPSPATQEFIKRLISSLAYSVGLDPQILFYAADLNSASTRFTLQKFKLWKEGRLLEREAWANAVYQHVIACEVSAGRLRPCADLAWQNVIWIPGADLTIDKGREVTGEINLIREGLADANAWTLATEGLTVRQILSRRAADLAAARDLAEAAGVPLELLMPGALGSTAGTPETDGDPPPGGWQPEPDPEPEA